MNSQIRCSSGSPEGTEATGNGNIEQAAITPNGGKSTVQATTTTSPDPDPQPNYAMAITKSGEDQTRPPISKTTNATDEGVNDKTIEEELQKTDHDGSRDESDMAMDVDKEPYKYGGGPNGDLEKEDVEMRGTSNGMEDGESGDTPTSVGGESTTKSDEEVPDKGISQIGPGSDHTGASSTINDKIDKTSILPTHDLTATTATRVDDASSSPTATSFLPTATVSSLPAATVSSSSTTILSIAELPTCNANDVALSASNRGASAAGIINAVVRNVSLSNINIPDSADIDINCPAWLDLTLECLRKTSTHPMWQELVTNLVMFEKSGPATGVSLRPLIFRIPDLP